MGAGTEVFTFGASGQNVSLTYNAVLGGWITNFGGVNDGVPLEVQCEICNRSNVGIWVTIPLFYSNQAAYDFGNKLQELLNRNLPAVVELSNEVWNFGQGQTGQAMNLGICLGWPQSDAQNLQGFYGLRVRQLLPQFANGWTQGRSRSDLVCTLGVPQFGAQVPSYKMFRLNGGGLVTSNSTYKALSGPGGTAGSDYNTFPNRPIDVCDAISYASYYFGAQLGETSSNFFGSISNFSVILKANADYASGRPALMASALSAVENDLRHGGGGRNSGGTLDAMASQDAAWERVLSTYDAQRAGAGMSQLGSFCYEGGYQAGLSANLGNVATTTTDLVNQFANNGWNTSILAYGASPTIVAQNLINLLAAFKNSNNFKSCVFDQYMGAMREFR
jgi:hypothetical protein